MLTILNTTGVEPVTLAQAACGIGRTGSYEWEQKPAGRVATSIPICWPAWHGQAGAGHIDLSVMPLGGAA